MSVMRSILAISTLALVACGGSAPPPQAPEPEPEPVKTAAPPPMKASQELGSIDEQDTNKTFTSLQSQLLDCQKSGMQRVEFLAGAVRWAYLEDSTLGDRDTEKCMLGVVSGAQWPKPDGGEAEVQKSMTFDGGDARPPAPWTSSKVSSVLAKQADEALQCKKNVRGVFKVTAYVEPAHHKGGKFGKVVSVGVSAPIKDSEEKCDCIASAVKDWKMPSPGSYAAKVTFSL
jgi:hypothetical protein